MDALNPYGRYLIYLRKSRADLEAEARGEGETLARHEMMLLELARTHRITVGATYKELVSGETIAARPIMQRVLSEVERGLWDGVLVVAVDRLARGDTMDQGRIAKSFRLTGTKIITPTKIYDPSNYFDEEYFEYGLFMARQEYKIIKRRMQDGRVVSAKQGKFVGNRPPYGWDRVKLEHDKGFQLVPNPEQAPVVKMMFDLCANGILQDDGTYLRYGTSRIARRLNELGIPSATGKSWTPSGVRSVLTNPAHAGLIRWAGRPSVTKMVDGVEVKSRPRAPQDGWILVDGLHKSMIYIDPKIYDAAQDSLALESRAHPPVADRKTIKNPLSGLVICGVCGRRMVRRPYPVTSGTQDTLMCPATSCSTVSSALSYVEERVLSGLAGWLREYKVSWQTNQEPCCDAAAKKGILQKLDKDLAKLTKQLDHLHDLLEQEVYSVETFTQRSGLLADKIKNLQSKRTLLLQEIDEAERREEQKRTIVPKVERLLDVYHDLPSAGAKNEMLKDVLEKVIYRKNKNGRWHNTPDAFEITLYPRLPK